MVVAAERRAAQIGKHPPTAGIENMATPVGPVDGRRIHPGTRWYPPGIRLPPASRNRRRVVSGERMAPRIRYFDAFKVER